MDQLMWHSINGMIKICMHVHVLHSLQSYWCCWQFVSRLYQTTKWITLCQTRVRIVTLSFKSVHGNRYNTDRLILNIVLINGAVVAPQIVQSSSTELQTQQGDQPPLYQSPHAGSTLRTNTSTQYIMEQAVCVDALLGSGAFSKQHAECRTPQCQLHPCTGRGEQVITPTLNKDTSL